MLVIQIADTKVPSHMLLGQHLCTLNFSRNISLRIQKPFVNPTALATAILKAAHFPGDHGVGSPYVFGVRWQPSVRGAILASARIAGAIPPPAGCRTPLPASSPRRDPTIRPAGEGMDDVRYDFATVNRLEAEAIGRPGQRTFRIILGNERGETAVLWIEKEQIQALGDAIERLLA